MAWHQAAEERHEERVLNGMADVHYERQLQQRGLAAFAASAEAARLTCPRQLQNGLQQQALSHQLAAARGPGGHMSQPAGLHQRQLTAGNGGSRAVTTIIISRRGVAAPEEQEQVPPPQVAAPSHSSCTGAAEGMVEAVSNWRAAADYWRQRQQSYSQQQQPPAAAAQGTCAVGRHTAATLAELQVAWQQH